jgi:DNA polymerase III subunit gamma/tau
LFLRLAQLDDFVAVEQSKGYIDQSSPEANYTVVARRYRPKTFDQLIGQEHVAQALAQAVATGRVGHAYLFTGARGVGKTSSARIFAKVLNTPDGTSEELTTEISAAIDAGEDMDVIEIDGASNRGINEIRQLRANVNVRPSRARFKIYIIDEVHMLTKEAFNALLKTLEEPPAHVKFIFCTTDPDKIPITVLSRCQRFDFAPVKFDAIVKRLQEIATSEGYECEPDALALLARRAAGSMRDSQSLLEQVMSFSAGKITAEQVHALLGIADESLLLGIVEALYQHDALAAIAAADKATSVGADAGQLSEQLLNYLRDIMAVGVGGGPQLLKLASPLNYAKLQTIAQTWGLQTILSSIQILDESIVRMRTSVSASTLLEVALVQICQLEHLASIPALIAALNAGTAVVQKKKLNESAEVKQRSDAAHSTGRASPSPQDRQSMAAPVAAAANQVAEVHVQSPAASATTPSTSLAGAFGSDLANRVTVDVPVVVAPSGSASVNDSRTQQSTPLAKQQSSRLDASHNAVPRPHLESPAPLSPSPANGKPSLESGDALTQWRRATQTIEGLLADYCSMVVKIEPAGSGAWRVVLPPGAVQARDYCDQPARKSQLIAALTSELGRPIQLNFDIQPGQPPSATTPPANTSAERSKRMREIANHPLIKKIVETLDGEITKVVTVQRPPGTAGTRPS